MAHGFVKLAHFLCHPFSRKPASYNGIGYYLYSYEDYPIQIQSARKVLANDIWEGGVCRNTDREKNTAWLVNIESMKNGNCRRSQNVQNFIQTRI